MSDLTNNNQHCDRVIRRQAADWLLIIEGDANDEQFHQWNDWLQQSERHQEIWQQTYRSWQLMAKLSIDDVQAAEPTTTKPPKICRLAWTTFAIAASFLVAVLSPSLILYWQADEMTTTAQTRLITLSDGSQVTLGANSAIAVNYSEQQRAITLLKGQAFFDVSHNKQRPFIVTTPQANVEVLGTQFDVEALSNHAYVAVASGSVGVTNNLQLEKILSPGDLMSVANDGVMAKLHVPVEQIAPWREQRLFVQSRTIADVVDTVRRYYDGIIIVTNDTLKTKRVTGSYQLSQIDNVLDAVVLPHGGKVTKVGPMIRVISLSK